VKTQDYRDQASPESVPWLELNAQSAGPPRQEGLTDKTDPTKFAS